MATKSAFSSVGLAHKLCLAAEGQGYTPELLNALAEHQTLLGELRKVQLGLSEIKPIAHAIDCDADPFIPDDWEVEEHTKGGIFTWDPTKVRLYLSKKQNAIKYILGNKLRKELKSQPVLNANVLDYLLARLELIPEDWKGRAVFFWGTIYRYSDDKLYVRYLYFSDNGRWLWGSRWLDDSFRSRNPAAVRAS
jgi:hypothetical protein